MASRPFATVRNECPAFEELISEYVDLRASQDGKAACLAIGLESCSQVLGCYSPCSKMTLRQWNNEQAEGADCEADESYAGFEGLFVRTLTN